MRKQIIKLCAITAVAICMAMPVHNVVAAPDLCCGTGRYNDPGTFQCFDCPDGSTTTGSCATSCDVCLDGYTKKDGVCKPATTCSAGQYLNDGGTCTSCEIGYYCPGDDKRYNCTEGTPITPGLREGTRYSLPYYSDETGLSACKTCPEITASDVKTPLYYSYWAATEGTPESYIHTTVNQCWAQWEYKSPHGSFQFSCQYGQELSYTATRNGNKCTVKAYLSNCDAGYWINPDNDYIYTKSFSKGQNVAFISYWSMMNNDFCTPVGVGYWSDGTSLVRNQCTSGSSTRQQVATSEDDCIGLCNAGVTQLKTGNGLSFNMYRDKLTTPAINIKLAGSNTTCYVPLATGTGNNTINLNVDGTLYHVTN